jgi:hypothetical protein
LQDAYASIVAPADGKYFIEVRESAYAGGNNYRLHVGTFPRPTAVYPAGGKFGEETEVKFLGLPTGDLVQKVTLPAEDVTDFGVFAQDDGGIAPTGNNFRLFEHGNAFEAEPNNEIATALPLNSRWLSTVLFKNQVTSIASNSRPRRVSSLRWSVSLVEFALVLIRS